MNAKIKACFTPHVVYHSLFALGLGILLVSLVPSFGVWWFGVILMLVGITLDTMRKS